jgi:hypothetical protein
MKKFGIETRGWGVVAVDRRQWRRALFTGKKKCITDWLSKRAMQHRKRHEVVEATPTDSAFFSKQERLQERHVEVVKFSKVDRAMRDGCITLRPHQVFKSDFVKGKGIYRQTKTKRTLEVGLVLDLLCDHVESQAPWPYADKGKGIMEKAGRRRLGSNKAPRQYVKIAPPANLDLGPRPRRLEAHEEEGAIWERR